MNQSDVIVGAEIALVASLLTVVITALIDWRRRVGERAFAVQQSTADRLRIYALDRVRDTRDQLIAIVDAELMFASGSRLDISRGKQLMAKATSPIFANALLIGNQAVAQEFLEVGQMVFSRISKGWRAFLFPLGVTFTAAERDRLNILRIHLMQALEAQHVRALRDQPLVELDPTLFRADPGLQTLEHALSDDDGDGSAEPTHEGAR